MQAALHSNKKIVEILKKVGFSGGNFDPCLYMKKSTEDIVQAALHIYHNLMVGNLEVKDEAMELL